MPYLKYLAPGQRPELPPGYAYIEGNGRVYISYAANGLRSRLCKPQSRNEQYWTDWKNAALAAWKHAYEHKGER